MSVEQTDPAMVSQATMEDITWGIDCSAMLGLGVTAASATATLYDPNNNVVALADSVSVTNQLVTQRVRAGVIEGPLSESPTEYVYSLVVVVNPTGSTNWLATMLQISWASVP